MKILSLPVLILGVLLFATFPAHAADLPTFKLVMKSGQLIPATIEVPAATKFRLEITNAGTDAAEFESLELRKESVLAPGVTRTLVFAPMKPGRYPFFDDFHPDTAKGFIVAQ
ncbi:MAG: cupredoxin domain-containing protein [Azoarcus sp.]|nr:cupredoxin domain-containing protein [Azoarcus sp.]